MKIYLVAFIFLFCSQIIFSGSLAKTAKKARMKSGEVITHSPNNDDRNDKKTDLKLSKGSVLFLEPGHYRNPIKISNDNVVIEGEMAAWCDLDLVISGKNCILRNIWISRLEAEEEITVVDCRIDELNTFGDDRNKGKQYFINSCFVRLKMNIGNKKMFFENCTVQNYTQGDPAIMIHGGGNGSLTFSDCVLSSDNFVMRIDCSIKNKIQLDNCLIFGKEFLAERQMPDSHNKNKKPKEAKNLKEIRKYCKVNLKGKNINKEPLYEYSLHHDFYNREKMPGALFRLKKDSPGSKEKMGVNLGQNDFPTPP